jgi:hypothetical protein
MRLLVTQKLSNSLEDCLLQLEAVQKRLEPGEARKAMSRFRVRALKWPFRSKEVERIIHDLERHKQAFSSALQVDQTWVLCAHLFITDYSSSQLYGLVPLYLALIRRSIWLNYLRPKERHLTRTWRSIMQNVLQTLGLSYGVRLQNGQKTRTASASSG